MHVGGGKRHIYTAAVAVYICCSFVNTPHHILRKIRIYALDIYIYVMYIQQYPHLSLCRLLMLLLLLLYVHVLWAAPWIDRHMMHIIRIIFIWYHTYIHINNTYIYTTYDTYYIYIYTYILHTDIHAYILHMYIHAYYIYAYIHAYVHTSSNHTCNSAVIYTSVYIYMYIIHIYRVVYMTHMISYDMLTLQ